jgi:hypothetical protein
MSCEQRSALSVFACCRRRSPREFCGFDEMWRCELCGRERLTQRRVDGLQTGGENGSRACELPDARHAATNEFGVEVVERGDYHFGRYRAHRCDTGTEVAHAVRARPDDAGSLVGRRSVRREVDHAVYGLKGTPGLSSNRGVHRRTLRAAVPITTASPQESRLR